MQYRGLTLDPFQETAIAALERGHVALVCAPTGTGKTIIADWVVEEALKAGQQVIYTAPIKALSNQKFRDYVRLYGEERVGLVTGDLVIRRDAPCLVMTTEILRNMLLGGEQLEQLRAVVLDEIHFLDDRERGTVWEEVLIYLPHHVQIVGLSATLSNLGAFAEWLKHVRQREVEVVVEEKRAVPLQHHLMSVDTGLVDRARYEVLFKRKRTAAVAPSADKRERGKRRPSQRTSHLDTIDALIDEDMLPALYFVFSRRDTERYARRLGDHLRRDLVDGAEAVELKKRLRQAAIDLGPALDPDVRALYETGIAFHHAGLHVQLKTLVEELYEARLIKVLFCTSTFALGINMPSRCVVFDGVRMFDGKTLAPLPTRSFMQMAGRAGRRGLDEQGHVVVRCDLDEYEEVRPHLLRYEEGAYEPVRSSFNLSWNSIVNLLATHELEQIRTIVEKSFLSWFMDHTAKKLREQASAAPAKRGIESKEAKKLHKRADRAEERCWDEFQAKVGYLQSVGYLGDDLSFNAGAKVLRNLQISEILMTELVLSGALEDLEPNEIFGVCCAVTNELGRHVRCHARPSRDDKALMRTISNIHQGPVVTEASSITEVDVPFYPDLFLLGRAWAQGKPLQEVAGMLISDTDVSGDLISGFRRAKDLIGQLREVYRDDPDRAEALRELQRKVARDEVEVVG
jgi:superfamily II RNA helicase